MAEVSTNLIAPPELMGQSDFGAFLCFAFAATQPGVKFEWQWYVDCMAEHLMAMKRMEIPRMVINIPPRCLKSYTASQAFAAWLLGTDPSDKIINVSYGASVVEQNAMRCKAIIKSDYFKKCFPDFRLGQLDRITHFQSSMGGHYYADTALSTITGIGCNWMIMDDLLKPMEALSDQVRTATNENMRATLFNRFDDRRIARALMIMQRLHTDDPAGNWLKDGGVFHLKLPAEVPKNIFITLDTPRGTCNWNYGEELLLSPSRLSKETLQQIEMDMTPYHYAGQMLQEPVPVGGGEFKDNWVQYYEDGGILPKTMNVVILCDPAGGEELNKKKKKKSDWTAFIVVGLAPDNNYYVLDIVRDRLNPTERIDTLFTLHRKWNALCGKPPKVGYEKYGMMTDTHYIAKKKKQEGYNFPLVPLGGQMIKEERIRRLIPDMQQGRWYFPANLIYVDIEGRRFDLINELVNSEMATFPRGRFDDMIDALSRTYDPELSLVFPKLQAKASQNITREGNDKPNGPGWLEF